MQDEQLAEQALQSARDTRILRTGWGVRKDTAYVFNVLFGTERPIIVADTNTFSAAGRDVEDSLGSATKTFVFESGVYAEYAAVERLRAVLQQSNAIPVAVGSGTINDLTKLASHQVGRPYMTVATAASMDGYTAYGASITHEGSKQTFDCPAPRGVVADLEVIAQAPDGMNASGYADLLAKRVAGADWILAAAAGVEPIRQDVWDTVQQRLRVWLANPKGIRESDPECLKMLVYGLMLSGFAMQAAQTSRPASGADHQFSHLWDMEHHTYKGAAPSHGFKVGIGTLASSALYEFLLAQEDFDIEDAVSRWPSLSQLEAEIEGSFSIDELIATARKETRAKYVGPEELKARLGAIQDNWTEIRRKLTQHLFSFTETADMLRAAGGPYEPEQIGITRSRLRRSYAQAYFIRRRFTVLDLVWALGLKDQALAHIFGAQGPWKEIS